MSLVGNSVKAVKSGSKKDDVEKSNSSQSPKADFLKQIEVADEVLMIPWQIIHPDPDQPRTKRDESEFLKVKMLIKATGGNSQAISVRPHPVLKGEYMIVYGEGRWLSCKEFDFKVKATLNGNSKVVSPIEVFDNFFMQVAENVGRNELSTIDEAKALQRLIDLSEEKALDNPNEKKLTQKDIADLFGYSKTKVSRLLSLLSAPDNVKDLSGYNVTQNLNVLTTLSKISLDVSADKFSEIIDDVRAGQLNEKDLSALLKKIKEPENVQSNESANSGDSSGAAIQVTDQVTNDESSGAASQVTDQVTNDESSGAASQVTDQVTNVDSSGAASQVTDQVTNVDSSGAANKTKNQLTSKRLIDCETFELAGNQLLVYGKGQQAPIVLSSDMLSELKALLAGN